MIMDIYVLDTSFNTVAIVDSYSSFIWTDRYNEYGDFEIALSPHSSLMEYLTVGNYLWRNDSEHVMIIKSIQIKTDAESAPEAYVTGQSLESILANRVIAKQTVLDGSLQNGIETLLNDAIINPSDTNRKIPNFIFRKSNDSVITSLTLQAQYFGENLYDTISDICYSESIGFKIILEGSNLVFELYRGVDRSYDQTDNPYVIFSPKYDNLLNSNYLFNVENVKNAAYICGEEEGEDADGNVLPQIVTSVGDASGLSRKEIFVSATSLKSNYRDDDNNTVYLTTEEYTNQLQQKGTEELAEYSIEESFDGQIESSVQWVIGKDFFMGDVVQIENEYGMTAKSRVVEMITSDSDSGLEFYPSFESVD